MNRTWIAGLLLSSFVGCASTGIDSSQQEPAGHAEASGQETPAAQDAKKGDTAAEKVTTGHAILMWLPNRIFDILDIVRARVRIGPGLGVGARATELADFSIGGWSSIYVGLRGPRGKPVIPWPFGVETYSGAELSVFDGSTEDAEDSPNYGPMEIGAGVHALIVGVDVGVEVWEVIDFVVGLAFFDPVGDDGVSSDRFTLRPIEPRDDAAVASVIRTVMPEFGASGAGFSIMDAEVDAMCATYRRPRSAYFVVEVAGRVVGGAGIAPLTGGDATTCELRKMYFLQEARGIGAGRALLDACLAAAKEHGFARCYLETLASMKAAARLYVAAGFAPLPGAMGATGHFKCDAWFAKQL